MPQAKHAAEWHLIEIRFKRDADMDALFAAVDPPVDVREQTGHDTDTLEGRLLAWGWGANTSLRTTGRVDVIGVYGDYTWAEDDERFMPLIAPFVAAGSRAVFDMSTETDSFAGFLGAFEEWTFDGTGVIRSHVERIIDFV